MQKRDCTKKRGKRLPLGAQSGTRKQECTLRTKEERDDSTEEANEGLKCGGRQLGLSEKGREENAKYKESWLSGKQSTHPGFVRWGGNQAGRITAQNESNWGSFLQKGKKKAPKGVVRNR